VVPPFAPSRSNSSAVELKCLLVATLPELAVKKGRVEGRGVVSSRLEQVSIQFYVCQICSVRL